MFHWAEKYFFVKMGHRTELSNRFDCIIRKILMRQGTESSHCSTFFGEMPCSFSVGFRWLVSRLKGRSKEGWSVSLPPDNGL